MTSLRLTADNNMKGIFNASDIFSARSTDRNAGIRVRQTLSPLFPTALLLRNWEMFRASVDHVQPEIVPVCKSMVKQNVWVPKSQLNLIFERFYLQGEAFEVEDGDHWLWIF
jgi:hypothetical protein